MKQWILNNNILEQAPKEAEQLRIDSNGNLYWSNIGKTWTKGFKTTNYSANSSDLIILTKSK